MRTHRLLSVTFAVLALTLLTVTARSQHLVLFETITNQMEPHITGVDTRAQFDQNVKDEVSSESSKIIHLNHHYGNESDVVICTNSTSVANKLAPGGWVFYAGVDRMLYGSGSPGPRGSGDPADWTSGIDAEAGTTDIADLSLNSIEFDTVTLWPNYIMKTSVHVTLNQSISDSMVLRFAIVQDNVTIPTRIAGQADGTRTFNDIVRYLSVIDTGTFCVFTPGTSAGTSKDIVTMQEIAGATVPKPIPWLYSKLRLIGFLEENPKGDFHVVNAATLKSGMTNLPQLGPSIILNDKILNGQTYYAPLGLGIPFTGTNIPSVDGYYSLDNGTTWVQYDTASTGTQGWPFSFDTWDIPSYISSTQAKVKLVIHGTNITAVESGTFTIIRGSSVSWVHPAFTETDTAQAKSHFNLQWSKFVVDSVTLQYQVQYGGLWSAWHPIFLANNLTGTSFDWILPDTLAYIQVRLLPDSKAESNGASSQLGGMIMIQRSVAPPIGVAPEGNTPVFAIQDVYPNPVTGGDVLVRYSVAKPCDLQFEVLDILGHQVFLDRTSVVQPGDYPLKTSSLPNGTYTIRVSDGTNTASKRMEILR